MSTAQAGAKGRDFIILSLMNRLNKTGSAIFILYFGLVALEGSTFHQIFFTSKVILAQATNVYFDHPQEPDPEERGLYWATRFTDTLKVLKFMPDSLYDNIFEERSGKKLTKTDVCGENSEKCEKLEKTENVIGKPHEFLQDIYYGKCILFQYEADIGNENI